jgi:hypothetical protein
MAEVREAFVGIDVAKLRNAGDCRKVGGVVLSRV